MKFHKSYLLFALSLDLISSDVDNFNVRMAERALRANGKMKKKKSKAKKEDVKISYDTCHGDGQCLDAGNCSRATCDEGMCNVQYLSCGNCTIANGKDVTVTIKTDDHPDDYTYTIVDINTNSTNSTNSVLMFSNPYLDESTKYTDTKCFAPGQYKFTISDKYGDGITTGHYKLEVGGVEVDGSGVPFDHEKSLYFNIIKCMDDYKLVGVEMNIVLDDWPNETSWKIEDAAGAIKMKGDQYSTSYEDISETDCLLCGDYKLNISDSGGDGIYYEQGKYPYTLKVNGTVKIYGGKFQSEVVHDFNIPCPIHTCHNLTEMCVNDQECCLGSKCRGTPTKCCFLLGHSCTDHEECCSGNCPNKRCSSRPRGN